jgi:arylsulfatase A-like enzyme
MRLKDHIFVSSYLLAVAAVVWGLVEIITIFSSSDFEQISFTAYLSILAFPLVLYGLTGFLLGTLAAALVYLLLGGRRGSFFLPRALRFYTLLYYVPLLLGVEYLWNRRYLPGIPATTPLSILHSLGVLAAVTLAAGLSRGLIRMTVRGLLPVRRSLAIGLLLAAALTAWLVAGPRTREEGPAGVAGAPTPERPNVLLITIDTLRADHLGCYGAPREDSPRIDALAAAGVRFTRATSQVPLTLPSHTSILTSTCPPVHGVRDNARFRFGDTAPTLAGILRGAGYRTAAFVSAFVLDSRFGLDRGFETYNDEIQNQALFYFTSASPPFALAGGMKLLGLAPPYKPERKADRTTDAAIAWLEANRSQRFFLWIHYFDPHGPLNPPPPYDILHLPPEADPDAFRRSVEDIIAVQGMSDARALSAEEIDGIRVLYRGEVTFTDHHVGRLLDTIESLGLADRTLTVLTADHGQSLAEHDYIGHSMQLYDDILRVPLILHQPGRIAPGRTVDNLVQSIDIMPTILRHTGVEVPGSCRGRDLHALIDRMDGGAGDPPAYLETLHPRGRAAQLVGLATGRYKYIRALEGTREELYRIDRDPGETTDLSSSEPERVQAMRRELQDLLAGMESYADAHEIPIDARTMEAMKALGYVQ